MITFFFILNLLVFVIIVSKSRSLTLPNCQLNASHMSKVLFLYPLPIKCKRVSLKTGFHIRNTKIKRNSFFESLYNCNLFCVNRRIILFRRAGFSMLSGRRAKADNAASFTSSIDCKLIIILRILYFGSSSTIILPFINPRLSSIVCVSMSIFIAVSSFWICYPKI